MTQQALLRRIAMLESRPLGLQPICVCFVTYDADDRMIGAVSSDGTVRVSRRSDETVRSVFGRLLVMLRPGVSAFAVYGSDADGS